MENFSSKKAIRVKITLLDNSSWIDFIWNEFSINLIRVELEGIEEYRGLDRKWIKVNLE